MLKYPCNDTVDWNEIKGNEIIKRNQLDNVVKVERISTRRNYKCLNQVVGIPYIVEP